MGEDLIKSAEIIVERPEQNWSAQIAILFQNQSAPLVAILTRLTGNQSEAEDIVQETFLKLYRRHLIIRNPAGWLYRSAFRLGLNALRREKRRDRWHKNAYSAGVLPSTPDVQLQSLEQQALARRVLVRMRERLARVLILRHSGLSFLEIAEIIGINVSSVGTMLNRAEKDFEKNYLKLSKGERPSVSGSLCI